MDIISELKFSPSNGETRRLIKQGGVSLDGDKVQDVHLEITLKSGDEKVLKVASENSRH